MKVWKNLQLISANCQHLRHELIVIGLVAGSDNGIPVCSGDELFPGESGKCKSCDNVTRGGPVAPWDIAPSLILLEDCFLPHGWEEHYTLNDFTFCFLCRIFGILEDFFHVYAKVWQFFHQGDSKVLNIWTFQMEKITTH